MGSNSKRRPAKLSRTLTQTKRDNDPLYLAGQLESFLTSPMWQIIQGVIAEEAFVHESAMRTFLRKSNLSNEAAYELGATEALEAFSQTILRQFIETLRTGKPAGVVESERPNESDPDESPSPEG